MSEILRVNALQKQPAQHSSSYLAGLYGLCLIYISPMTYLLTHYDWHSCELRVTTCDPINTEQNINTFPTLLPAGAKTTVKNPSSFSVVGNQPKNQTEVNIVGRKFDVTSYSVHFLASSLCARLAPLFQSVKNQIRHGSSSVFRACLKWNHLSK